MTVGRSPSMRREWIEIGELREDHTRSKSPSMRREWIEMLKCPTHSAWSCVSLHAEGVD